MIIGGENAVISIIDMKNYEIIDCWSLGYQVHCLDAVNVNEHFMIAAGCEAGSLKIRKDWDHIVNLQVGEEKIVSVKFVKRGEVILASSMDSKIYMIKNVGGEY